MWEDLQERLCLGCEVKSIFCLMVINPAQAVAIVKEYDFPAPKVDQESREDAIQSGKESVTGFFIKMDEATRILWIEHVASRFEFVHIGSVEKILSDEQQADIFRLVPNRQTVGIGIAVTDPSGGKAESFYAQRSGRVAWFVQHRPDHGVDSRR